MSTSSSMRNLSPGAPPLPVLRMRRISVLAPPNVRSRLGVDNVASQDYLSRGVWRAAAVLTIRRRLRQLLRGSRRQHVGIARLSGLLVRNELVGCERGGRVPPLGAKQ